MLEPEWEEDSSVTVNINAPVQPHTTPSQFEKLKEMKTGTKVGIGGSIIVVVTALVELARRLGWL